MPYDISELPTITKRTLRDDQMIFTLNTESKDIIIQAVMEDEYDNGKTVTRSRPKVTFRDEPENLNFTNAFNQLFPNDDNVVWTNPRQTLQTKLMELIKGAIVK